MKTTTIRELNINEISNVSGGPECVGQGQIESPYDPVTNPCHPPLNQLPPDPWSPPPASGSGVDSAPVPRPGNPWGPVGVPDLGPFIVPPSDPIGPEGT